MDGDTLELAPPPSGGHRDPPHHSLCGSPERIRGLRVALPLRSRHLMSAAVRSLVRVANVRGPFSDPTENDTAAKTANPIGAVLPRWDWESAKISHVPSVEYCDDLPTESRTSPPR